eukprot:283795-Ditylum_brightwellii.AAC.1
MCNNGTETQQSAGIGNRVKRPNSMCSLHMEQITPNSMCNNNIKPNTQQGSDRRWMIKTQQSAGIGRGMDDEDSTISRGGKEDKGLDMLT